ncbi:GMP/IMP nucleotidase [Shewanella abyssi]|uniref:GMP/IMP nucleotidase n=1 Tax=Shewanella abyssi TaxID=311789 RepID=UPI00200EB8B9|nr:GMP/IMP nucleotidase [Shewanella abyssi]MCL1050298.1 GMP/IMP nucleotidase [Shewanella abyssi]
MFPWREIDTVLLDMDGTLLDLHFDNHFWLNLIPKALSEQRNISEKSAMEWVEKNYQNVEGTLDWYCLDYWEQKMGLDIMTLHKTLVDRIQLRQDSLPFLYGLKQAGKNRILVTNAHPKGLALKLEHTDLALGLDEMISSHETGYPKEHPLFWQQLFSRFNLDPSRCLFIDDNEAILAAAKLAGVGYQLGVANPDSNKPNKQFADFPAIADYHHLLDDLLASNSI